MHAQARTADPSGRRVLTTLLVGALLGLAALLGMTGSGQAAQSHGGDLFGSIAVDRSDGTFGFSFNFRTRALAEARSLSECRLRSDTSLCRNVVWVRNGCAAVAVRRRPDRSLSRIAWAIAPTRSGAQSNALGRCGTSCRVLAFTCTSRR